MTTFNSIWQMSHNKPEVTISPFQLTAIINYSIHLVTYLAEQKSFNKEKALSDLLSNVIFEETNPLPHKKFKNHSDYTPGPIYFNDLMDRSSLLLGMGSNEIKHEVINYSHLLIEYLANTYNFDKDSTIYEMTNPDILPYIRTTKQAAIKVTKAVLFLKNFSLAITNYFKCLRACFISAIRSLGSSNPICNLTRCSSFANFKNFRVPVSLYS